MTLTRDIFISHASGDHVFAYRLALNLARFGFTVWIDMLDIRPGSYFQKEYTQAIHESSVVLVVLSPRSSDSAWVYDEISHALARERNSEIECLIPILIESCEIPKIIAERAYVDFRYSFTHAMSLLIDELKNRVPLQLTIDIERAESMIVPIELRNKISLIENHFHQFEGILYALPSNYQIGSNQIRLSLADDEVNMRKQLLKNADFADFPSEMVRLVEKQDQYIQEGVALILNKKFRGNGWEDIPRIPLLAGFLKCERSLCLRYLLAGQLKKYTLKNDYENYLDRSSDFWSYDQVVEVRVFLETREGRKTEPYKAVFPKD
ncbi:MAG TPA: toll/interleukin-1 receptor domain-containing protein, partial [Desulfobulbaceae bacterium]|nr:toll/interleukin-1 receptor domain-containing protein [Desulfobulbaceae bacterium]